MQTTPSGADACQVCGRRPAERFKVRRHVGMFWAQQFHKLHVVLCRDHGEALAREFLGKTLILGWWG